MPLGVLQSGSVAFSPPLPLAAPAKASALSRLGTGIYNKVCILCAATVQTVSCISALPIPATRNRFDTHHAVVASPEEWCLSPKIVLPLYLPLQTPGDAGV